MKKFLMIGFLVAYSHFTNAQSAAETGATTTDTTPTNAKVVSLEERLNKQEGQLQALKKENEVLKKEMKQVKSVFNPGRKIIVSRTGSKQLIVQ